MKGPVAKFSVSDWGDIVDSGIGVTYWPASLYSLEGPVRRPYASVEYISLSRTKNLATGLSTYCICDEGNWNTSKQCIQYVANPRRAID